MTNLATINTDLQSEIVKAGNIISNIFTDSNIEKEDYYDGQGSGSTTVILQITSGQVLRIRSQSLGSNIQTVADSCNILINIKMDALIKVDSQSKRFPTSRIHWDP